MLLVFDSPDVLQCHELRITWPPVEQQWARCEIDTCRPGGIHGWLSLLLLEDSKCVITICFSVSFRYFGSDRCDSLDLKTESASSYLNRVVFSWPSFFSGFPPIVQSSLR